MCCATTIQVQSSNVYTKKTNKICNSKQHMYTIAGRRTKRTKGMKLPTFSQSWGEREISPTTSNLFVKVQSATAKLIQTTLSANQQNEHIL